LQFPCFQFPVFGDPLIIEIDAVLHVFISHGVAIGMVFMIVLAEYIGYKRNAESWERLAREAIKPTVIIVTGIGAVTGVGIWFITAGLVPPAIGSLLRVFFWPWFIEWNVFFWEVVVILVYYFTWHRWQGARRASHVHLGFGYVALGSISALLITGILAFMLTSDGWPQNRSFWSAFFNPSFLSQLCWRFSIAFTMGALFMIFYITFFHHGAEVFRQRAASYYAKILIIPLIGMIVTGWWWFDTIPPGFKAHAKPSILIWVFAENMRWFWIFHIGGGIILGLLIVAALIKDVPASRVLIIPSTLIVLFAVAEYERVREFIRGPYIMPGYMYANEVMLTEHELFTKEGMLPYAYWFNRMAPNATLEQEGAFLFAQNCGTCHTIGGKNDIRDRFAGRSERGIYVILGRTEQMVPWMPPFSGTDEERSKLSHFLDKLAERKLELEEPSRYPSAKRGGQTDGTAS
jgi:mono/diheme cytochrome c family protein